VLFAALENRKPLLCFGQIGRHHCKAIFKVRAPYSRRMTNIGQLEIWVFAQKL